MMKAVPTTPSTPLRTARWIPTLAILLLVAFGGSARAQSSNSALQFLGLGASARAAALSGATSGWIGDATAAWWNPAGLSRMTGWDISGTHLEWLSDIRYEQVSLARQQGGNGFALSFGTAYASDFDARDEVGNQQISFGFSDVSIGLSYARTISEALALGATAKYWRESIDDVAASGAAFDFGATWNTPAKGLSAGAAIRNVGGDVQFDFSGAGSFDLPQTIQVGLAYSKPVEALAGSILLAGDFVSEKNGDPSLRFGAQYRYREGLSVMAGYRADFIDNPSGVDASEKLDQTQDFSIGAMYDKSFRFEYAFVPFNSDLGSTHRFSIGKSW